MLSIAHHPGYVADIDPTHRFPMRKFGAVRDALERRGLLTAAACLAPREASAETLALAHDADYVARALAQALTPAEARRIGLPISASVIRRARLSVAGALMVGRRALVAGIACNSAGGSHHAGPEGGAGFCTFNDVAVAIRALQRGGAVRRALVVDCDAHQGDGTARIFADDPSVFTLSIHGARNYPFKKAVSDLDVALPDDCGDHAYLAALAPALEQAVAAGPFDLAFYNAGVDVHREDRLGRLALSDGGIRARDRHVIARLRAAGLPIAGVIGGGYGPDPSAIAERHAILFEEAAAALACVGGLGEIE